MGNFSFAAWGGGWLKGGGSLERGWIDPPSGLLRGPESSPGGVSGLPAVGVSGAGAPVFALELCGEAGELANLEKKEWKGSGAPSGAATPSGAEYADEAADVLIAVLNYANERGIDLAQAVREKMAEIDRRRLEAPGR